MIAEQRLGAVLEKRYPGTHDFATDKALWQYTQDLKNQFLRNAPPINKVMYDSKIHVLKNALGLHTAVSRVQGGKLKAKAEIRVATVHMEPQYHQLEFDTRLWLTQQSLKQTA
ncbi:MAG: hypothetical protein E6928_11890 [Citrobacter freundii]|nr:hypothetical protein [Citrobacter freundii]